MSFSEAYAHTMGDEGLYSNNPSDSGGETWKGIARNKWPNWKGWDLIDSLRSAPSFPKNLVQSKGLEVAVQDFYVEHFWDAMKCGSMPDALAMEVFDCGMNCGTASAGKCLQRILNVLNKGGTLYPNITADGQIGQGTLSALNAYLATRKDLNLLLKIFGVLRGNYYVECCEKREKNEDFIVGWMNNRVHLGVTQ